VDPDITSFYVNEFREDDRLRLRAHGVLERVRTQELLQRFLPHSPAIVLDIGGGTGVHAASLAESGYTVHLVDPVAEHVAAAAMIPGITVEVGDARSLAQADETQDAVLLLGPLYHLPRRDDRLHALVEACRVARPGAPVMAAGISRYATLMDIGSDGRLTEEVEPFLQQLHATGQFRGGVVGFTTAYFHRPEELEQELMDAGLIDVAVYGIEGPAGPTLRALGPSHLSDRLDAAVRAARIVERDPALIAASGHLLAVGRVPAAACESDGG
jgi:ubiquinone/menaquinone biosynthesis C-methylase UbiE